MSETGEPQEPSKEELDRIQAEIDAADEAGTPYIPDVKGRKAAGSFRTGGPELSDETKAKIWEETTGEPYEDPNGDEPEEAPDQAEEAS